MADLPVDRTTANTPTEHADDHNVLHATHNLIDGDGNDGDVLTRAAGAPTWAAPSGSSVPYLVGTARAKRTAANVGSASTTYVAVDTGTDLTISDVQTGDVLEVQANFRWNDDNELAFMDAATMVSASPVNYVSGSNSSGHGVGGWLGQVAQRMACGGSVEYVLQSGDISGGSVTVRFFFRTNGGATKTIIANTNQPFHVNAKVWRIA